MSEVDLLNRHPVELPAGTPTLPREQVQQYLSLVEGWELVEEGKTIRQTRRFENFRAAIDFVNQVADLAEEEGHHPDILVFSYRYVGLDLSTHSIGGLSDNDFIMAAKINKLTVPG
jgi:4a-hydroxytetrahydrobiopterin dehydratase